MSSRAGHTDSCIVALENLASQPVIVNMAASCLLSTEGIQEGIWVSSMVKLKVNWDLHQLCLCDLKAQLSGMRV